MVDKEKLLKAMECFIPHKMDKIPKTRDDCRHIGCPYAESDDCEDQIIGDCYDLIKGNDAKTESNGHDISNTINVMRKTVLTMLEIIEAECNRNEGGFNE